MASSKKKKSSKKSVAKNKPAAKKKPAPKSASKPKAKAKAKAKAPAKKTSPAKAKTKKPAKTPTHGDSWGNASLAPKVKSPKITNLEPSGTPQLALHDHEGGLVSPVDETEEVAERIHGGEEAVKDADEAGSAVLDDRDSDGDE